MNIIQQAEQLKDISDDRIAKEMRQPTGIFPLYLVSSEAKRRADLRQRFKIDQAEAPQTTVQQDLLAALAGQTQPPAIPAAAQQGGAPGAQPPPPPATPPMPQAPPGMASSMPPQMPPQIPPGNLGVGNVPTRGFAEGGRVRGFQNGGWLGQDFKNWRNRNMIKGGALSAALLNKPPLTSQNRSFAPLDPIYANDPSQSPYQNISEGGPEGGISEAYGTGYNVPPVANQSGLDLDPQSLSGSSGSDTITGGIQVTGTDFPPRPTFTAPGGTAGAGVKPLGDFTKLMDEREAKITASRGDPYKKFADIMATRADAVGDAETKNKWLAVARAGFEMAGGESQYALTNIGKGATAGLTEYTKGQAAIDARKDKNLALDMQLTGVQEKLKSEITTIAMAQANGQIDTQTASAQIAQKQAQLNDARVVEQNRNAERLAGHDVKKAEFQQRAALKREGIVSREKIAKTQAEAGGAFYKNYAAIEKNIEDPVERAAAHAAHIKSLRGAASPMRITRSHVTAMTNKLNKREAALTADWGTLMMKGPIYKGLRDTPVGKSTVYKIISAQDEHTPAEMAQAKAYIKAWVHAEQEDDPQFIEMVTRGFIPSPLMGASQAQGSQKGWGAVKQKPKPAAS